MEEWREIAGWHGKYLISNYGRFKSIKGKYKVRFPDGYITDGTIDGTGYRRVALRRPNHQIGIRVHSLVGNAFIPKPIDGNNYCINHIDGNKLNNHVSNLEWLTLGDNVRHAVRTGLFDIKGEKHHQSKLTKDMVIEMRRMYREDGLTQKQIGEKFGVCRRQAGDVINGVNWGWLKDTPTLQPA